MQRFTTLFDLNKNMHSHYVPLNSSQTEIFIPNAHYNLFYLPEVNGTLNYKTKRRKTLEILFTEQYLKDIIGTNFKQILHKIGTAISNKTAFLLWEKSKPISIELKSHIHQIVNCKYPDDLKKAYLEAKINELLIQLLAKTNENNYEEENSLLPIEDYKNILKISEYIHINLEKSLTITELAATIGVNTSSTPLTNIVPDISDNGESSIMSNVPVIVILIDSAR